MLQMYYFRYLTENNQQTTNPAELYINMIIEHATPKAVTIQDIQSAVATDESLQNVITSLQAGKWHKQHNQSYYNNHHQLSTKNDILLFENRLVIPKSLRSRILNIAHQQHQGIVRTKSLLREKV